MIECMNERHSGAVTACVETRSNFHIAGLLGMEKEGRRKRKGETRKGGKRTVSSSNLCFFVCSLRMLSHFRSSVCIFHVAV